MTFTFYELFSTVLFELYTRFRSATIRIIGCGPDKTEVCRQKEPIPKEKIYSERTVEFGVYVDMHLYKKMSVSTSRVHCVKSKTVFHINLLLRTRVLHRASLFGN